MLEAITRRGVLKSAVFGPYLTPFIGCGCRRHSHPTRHETAVPHSQTQASMAESAMNLVLLGDIMLGRYGLNFLHTYVLTMLLSGNNASPSAPCDVLTLCTQCIATNNTHHGPAACNRYVNDGFTCEASQKTAAFGDVLPFLHSMDPHSTVIAGNLECAGGHVCTLGLSVLLQTSSILQNEVMKRNSIPLSTGQLGVVKSMCMNSGRNSIACQHVPTQCCQHRTKLTAVLVS